MKKIFLLMSLVLVFSCKSTKKANCDAYGLFKKNETIEKNSIEKRKNSR